MLGGFALVPGDVVPKGAWLIGVGAIMLGLNAARYLKPWFDKGQLFGKAEDS